ncbi:MAG: DUF2953 domain-containing protein [Clostridia bacterium]|nr:DUF2953 domain-containing protein [Clostridia bacterium]
MNPLIIMGIIIAVLILILYIPIGIGLKYENGTFVIVKIAFKNFNIPLKKVLNKPKKKGKKEEKKKSEKELEKSIVGLDFVLSLFGDFRRFVRKRFSLSQFELKVTFGTAEAASTAVLTGHIYSLSYNILALIDKLMYVDNPRVEVTPVFNDATFSANAQGIIRTRLAHIIATATVFAYKFLKYKRNKKRRKTK